MSIADKITSIENHLKKDYQSIANLGADLTNVDKNIENIAELLDGVYDVLPKTSFQEGTDVTIENGLKGKLDFDNGVVGIGQSSQETTEGYNIMDFNVTQNSKVTINNDGTITINGNGGFNLNFKPITLNGGTTYAQKYEIVSGSISGTGATAVFMNFGNASYIKQDTLKTTTPEDTITSSYSWVNGGVTFNNCRIKFWSWQGSTDKGFESYTGGYASPSPNWEQPIQCVTGNQEIVVSGIQLFDKDNANILQMNLASSTTTSGLSASNRTLYIKIKPNTTYTISKIASSYLTIGTTENIPNFNMAYSQRQTNNTGTSITITTSSTANYLMVWYYNSGSDTSVTEQQILDSIMICEGTDTPYEPYHTPITYPISLGSKQLYDECYIVGSPDNWKFVDNYYKEKYKDTTIERLSTGTVGKYRFKIVGTYSVRPVTPSSNVGDIYSNILLKTSADSIYSCHNGIGITTAGSVIIYHNDFSEYTAQELIDYFANRDDYIVYPLATPIETPITDTTLITQLNNWYYSQSFNGTTIIESNGDLPMIIKCRGLKGE